MQPVISIVMVHIAMTCMIRILHGLSSDPSSAESKSIGITTIYRFGAALHVRRHGEVFQKPPCRGASRDQCVGLIMPNRPWIK